MQASFSNFCQDFHFFQHLRVSFRGDCGSYCFISDVKKTVKRAGGGVGRDTDWKCMDLFELWLQTVTITFGE